ncbi:MAG TPA: sulfide/dihydroorotate dehydrogenase-like FAD/NAD-binding protein, partial [Clostridia bacterium]|nr:sulfide/dihydroorotate dehydrogenase-like FAD/NAD-binding protein [Clostridia bacterium]
MYTILDKKEIAPNLKQYVIHAPLAARNAEPGQFVILRVTPEGERIPLTISDFDKEKGTVTLIVQEVGFTTRLMNTKNVGDSIADLAGPLGKATEYYENVKSVLCIGGGVGTAVLFPQVKMLHSRDVDVDVIIGGRSKEYVILEDELRKFSRNVYVTTDDGSYGAKGLVTDIMVKLIEQDKVKYDVILAVGPLIMMKVVSDITRKYGIKTIVSMNPIMIDGTGMCGGCRVSVGGEVKYACVDGPDFDGHLIDFDEAMKRQATYKAEEKRM